MQSSTQGLAKQVEEAAASERFDEASALQTELDSSTEEADALASEFAFTAADMQDIASALESAATQSLPSGIAPANTAEVKVESPSNSNRAQAAIADDQGSDRKAQDSQDLSTALSREGMVDYDDGDSVDVGYSSSVVSASHAATDGSRSVHSARTVLDRMPEFNMDDAISFRCGRFGSCLAVRLAASLSTHEKQVRCKSLLCTGLLMKYDFTSSYSLSMLFCHSLLLCKDMDTN